jgi:RNA polymerase sigma factor (TIGR02999 family)
MTISAEPGRPASIDARFSEVYSQLRRLARGQRSSGQDTLNTTALVHELYLQMRRGAEALQFDEPRQFYAYAAQAMRHLLVDRARARLRLKRGGDLQRVDLSESSAEAGRASPEQALALDLAMRQLAAEDARAAEVVELHYFAGLPIERVAELLGISPRTVDRNWRYARAFLHSQFAEG